MSESVRVRPRPCVCRSDALLLDPVLEPVDVAADLGVEAGVDAAALAARHDARDVVAAAVEAAHQRPAAVLLARVHRPARAKLARRLLVLGRQLGWVWHVQCIILSAMFMFQEWLASSDNFGESISAIYRNYAAKT